MNIYVRHEGTGWYGLESIVIGDHNFNRSIEVVSASIESMIHRRRRHLQVAPPRISRTLERKKETGSRSRCAINVIN